MCAGNIPTLLPDEISLSGLSEFLFSFFFFVTIIGLSLICQNERKQPQEKISSSAAEV